MFPENPRNWPVRSLVEEGEALRLAGVSAPILVLGATSPEEAIGGVQLGLTLTVCDEAMVRSVEKACVQESKECSVHLKIDSGMSRIGARTESEVQQVLQTLQACAADWGVYTFRGRGWTDGGIHPSAV